MITNTPLLTPEHQHTDSDQFSINPPIDLLKKRRTTKAKKSDVELIAIFWASAIEAFFGQETIAPVTNKSIKTLESDRWRGVGIPYRKVGGRVLYRKADVVSWLEGHKLIHSTSAGDANHGK